MKKIKYFEEFEQLNEEVKLSKIAKKQIIDGFTILIGRNAEMNDILTTEIAKPNDIWLHATGIPGSHVLIQVENEKPPKEVIKKAAQLAAQNSKGSGKINVVYTEAKNVTKNDKFKIGEVSVDYDKSHFIKVFSNN